MHRQRFLAAAWASVHGPADPRRLLLNTLDAGFAGLGVSPGPRAGDWGQIAAAAADLPIRFGAIRANDPLHDRSATAALASAKEGERQAAARAVHHAVAVGRQLRCPVVVVDVGVVPVVGDVEAEDLGDPGTSWPRERLEPLLARRKVGRNGAVDRVCRELFALVRGFPDMDFCVTQSRSARAVIDLRALQDVFEDLAQLRLFYWHDAALAARRAQVGLEAQGEWLESFGNRLRGMSLGDGSPDGIYLPPGAGGVDYALLGSYVPRTGPALPVVVELDVAIPAAELPGIRACLDKYGL
jgi:sugar phosphate isomerase/epimerase